MRSLTTALILALGVATLAAQTKQERAGIVNFTKVDAVVACGGATETTALDGLAKDGFKTVINLRLATEANANIEANAAHAKSLRPQLHPHPVQRPAARPEGGRSVPGDHCQQGESTGLHPLRLGQPRRLRCG